MRGGGEFSRIYPKQGRILCDGGLNNKFERSIIEDNESPDCLNVIMTNGAVETRQGVSKINTAAVGSFVGDGVYVRRANDNTQTMIAAWGGTVWDLQTTSFITIPSAQSLFTAGVRFGAAQDENYLFMGNGGSIPYKWNGANFNRHGVYPPTQTSTVASQAAGVLTGDYRYKITNVNSGLVESDVGPVTATFNAAGATLRVSSIQTFAASFGVTKRYVYRTAAGGSTFKYVGAIADNTTTTYDDNTADASLGATAPTDNGVPPKYNAIIYHQGRLFMNDTANPNYVWWTELGNPYTVASTNFKKVGDNTSDLVKGFAIHDNSLAVFLENHVELAYMPDTTPGNWNWVSSRSPYGSKSPYCLLTENNKVLFPAIDQGKFVGFAELSGDTAATSSALLTVSSAGSDRVSDRIETDMFSVNESYLANISGVVFKNKAYIALTYGGSATTNNRYYTYDFSLGNLKKNQKFSWVPNNGTPIAPAQFVIYNGSLYFQSATANGFLYKMENGTYSDDGSAINSYFWTKEYPGFADEVNFQKDFRYCSLLIETSGDYYMSLTWRTDSDSGSGDSQNIDLNPGGSLWGTMVWGRDTWGGGAAQREHTQYLGTSRGKRIQFKFSNQNTVSQKFKVYGMNFSYNRKGYR